MRHVISGSEKADEITTIKSGIVTWLYKYTCHDVDIIVKVKVTCFYGGVNNYHRRCRALLWHDYDCLSDQRHH